VNRSPSTAQWRLTLTAAVATVCASLVLTPTIRTGLWWWQGFTLVMVVATVGGVARQVRAPRLLVLLVTTTAVVATLTVMFVRDVAIWWLLPGPGAWRDAAALFHDGIVIAWDEPAPVAATPGTSLLVVTGIAVIAICVDTLAVTWRRAAVAGAPLLALYLVPAAVLPGGVPWPLFALCAFGWILILLVDGSDRLARWGRSVGMGRGANLALGMAGATGGESRSGATGRRLGVAAIGVAVVVPLALPALSEGLWGSGNGGAGPGHGPGPSASVVTVNPIVDLRRNLRETTAVPVLSYTTTASQPEYLQLATLDSFDGSTWRPAPLVAPASQQVSRGLPSPPGLSDSVARRTDVSRISILRLSDNRLPVPYPATQVSVTGDWRYDAATFDVFTPDAGTSTLGLDYQVSSLSVDPTRRQLRDATPTTLAQLPDLTVPDDVRTALSPYVAPLVNPGMSDYRKALAIQNWFRSTFTYSLQTRPGTSIAALQSFLHDRSGYCEQFAATMALMARVVGIPSRVVVGFTPGKPVPGQRGTWVVTTHDAHAWPQLWFGGVGWVRFEPTPGGNDGSSTPPWASPPSAGSQGPGIGSGPVPGQGPPDRQLAAPGLAGGARHGHGGFGSVTPPQRPAASTTWIGVAAGALALAVLLALVPATDRRVTRRRRRRTVATGELSPVAVEAAWSELTDTMVDLAGHPPRIETTRDIATRILTQLRHDPAAGAAVRRLGHAIERTRYAPAPAASPGPLWDDCTLVCEGLRAAASRREARTATWWPLSSRERLATAIGRAGVRMDRALAQAGSRLRRRVPPKPVS